MKIAGLGLNFIPEKVTDTEKEQGIVPFKEFLNNAVANVNQLQFKAEELSQKLVTGELNDIHQVMIASEKANLALQFTIQVRNKLVEAYQEVMRMQM